MVFRGRPSKACQRCRTRRLRCDLQPDCCGACHRAGVPCYGYRDVPTLRIHDETQSLQNKGATARAIPYTLQPAIESQARDLMCRHFTSSPQGWEFVLQIPTGRPGNLSLSLDVLSLAFLARYRTSPSLLQYAREQYASALQGLRRSLTPTATTEDRMNMLAATMLLDMFEKISHHGPGNRESRLAHLRGSIAIVKAIGLGNLNSHHAVQLLTHVVSNSTISCIANVIPVPEDLWPIYRHVALHRKFDDDFPWVITGLLMEYAFFRSALHDPKRPYHICIEIGRGIDQKLCALQDIIDNSVLSTSNNWNGFERWEIQNVSTFRFLIHEASLKKHQATEEDFTNESPPLDMISDLTTVASEILSHATLQITCPQHIRTQAHDKKTPSKTMHGEKRATATHPFSQIMTCYATLFPMYLIGRSKWTTAEQKDSAKSQLQYIDQHFGLGRAQVAQELIDSPHEIDPWHVFGRLGCTGNRTSSDT